MVNSIQIYMRNVFPEIKEWNLDYNEIRYSNNVKDMPFKTWFFFHFTAYKIVMYSYYILSMLIMLSAGLYFWIKYGIGIIPLLFMILTIYFGKKLNDFIIQDYYNKKLGKNLNLYDVLLRER